MAVSMISDRFVVALFLKRSRDRHQISWNSFVPKGAILKQLKAHSILRIAAVAVSSASAFSIWFSSIDGLTDGSNDGSGATHFIPPCLGLHPFLAWTAHPGSVGCTEGDADFSSPIFLSAYRLVPFRGPPPIVTLSSSSSCSSFRMEYCTCLGLRRASLAIVAI